MPSVSAEIAKALIRALPIYNGKGRIVDSSFLSRYQFPEELIDITTSDGFEMRVNPNDLVGRILYFTGRFDRCVVDAIAHFSEDGDCLWDIGANIGYVSCAFLCRFPNAHALSVEPLPDIAKILRHNVEDVGAGRSVVLEAAVSNTNGTSSIVRVPGNSGASHVVADGTGQSILLADGRALLDIAPPPDVIKIDVEGHEIPVLEGIYDVIVTNRPKVIVFEHHTKGMPVDCRVTELFDNAGYDVRNIWRRVDGWTLGPINTAPTKRYEPSTDFAATPKIKG